MKKRASSSSVNAPNTKLISRRMICPSISALPQLVAEFMSARLGCGNRTIDQIDEAGVAQHRQRGRGRTAPRGHLLAQHAGRILRACSKSGRAQYRIKRQTAPRGAVKTTRYCRRFERLDEMKDVGRPAA